VKVYLYKLRFQGPAHFGETGIELENVTERVSSDTFFSALVNALSTVSTRKEVTEFVQSFLDRPPFLISSLYIYTKDTYFLPKPFDEGLINGEVKRETGKELKKIRYLPPGELKKWLKGEINKEDLDTLQKIQKRYSDAFSIEIRPRVSLDRDTQQSALYHVGYVHFSENSGLFGLVAFRDESFVERFQAMLRILGETGLGGERTYGCGTFKVETFEPVPTEFEGLLTGNSDNYMTLSLYHPSEQEMVNLTRNVIAYDLVKRRGWITSGRHALPYKKKYAGFFVEGSVFKQKPVGCLVDVTPDDKNIQNEIGHRLYRYGYAFSIPLDGDAR